MKRAKWWWWRRGMSTLFSNFSDFDTLAHARHSLQSDTALRLTLGAKSSHSGVQNNTRAKRKLNFAKDLIGHFRKPHFWEALLPLCPV